MAKQFTFFEGATLRDVIGFALDKDEGSRTRDHRYLSEPCRLWVLRELLLNPKTRYIECFELACNDQEEWGLRGWSEEEGIPYTDVPLDLLAAASSAINPGWRQKALSRQAARLALPIGCWLHSTTGVKLPTGEVCHDFQYEGNGTFRTEDGRTWKLSPKVVSRLAKEGVGIATGRA